MVLTKGKKDDDPTCKTFILKGESHTLLNALRFVITKNPEVKFCAYALLHPTDDEYRLRIQTFEIPAKDVFKKGLQDLEDLSSHVLLKFEEECKKYDDN